MASSTSPHRAAYMATLLHSLQARKLPRKLPLPSAAPLPCQWALTLPSSHPALPFHTPVHFCLRETSFLAEGMFAAQGGSIASKGLSGREEPASFQINMVYNSSFKCFLNAEHFVISISWGAVFILKNPNLQIFYNFPFKKKESKRSLLLIIDAEHKCKASYHRTEHLTYGSQNCQHLRGAPSLNFSFITNTCLSNRVHLLSAASLIHLKHAGFN